ncbi:MAG: aminoacyl-histidine dipeptidase [Prevotella sp.]|nr:aminoacyl-histidine dipeptidase [Prevotella sp.]
MSEIKNLNPESIWRNFHNLTQVPRPSGHLEPVKTFLLNFAKEVGVEAFVDKANNIVMRKPATPGMESRKTITLQAHMDMVPQKGPNSEHNFETDPIQTWIDEGWVKAKDTTLGADNGLGVAAIMAVMEAKDLKHGPVEGLITADEETGMFGANDLPEGELQGDILLNLDSETWGTFVVGSAGGVDITATRSYKEKDVKDDYEALQVTIKGLKGGHSGLEIHEGRANANKLMARVVLKLTKECDAELASWHGGNMRNAIPYKAETVVVLPKKEVKAAENLIAEMKDMFENEYRFVENGVELFCEKVETPKKRVSKSDRKEILRAIYGCHNGVLRMIPAIPTVVETSSNLAIVDIENGEVAVKILARSSSETMKEYIGQTLKSVFKLSDFKVKFSGSYQGWDPNTDSEVLQLVKGLYAQTFGHDPIVKVDHAGLECSIILSKYPNMDVMSMGPTIRSPHSTSERCEIATVEPFWTLLKKVLEEAPEK